MKDAPFYLIIERQSDSIVKYQPGKSKEIDNENSERTEKNTFFVSYYVLVITFFVKDAPSYFIKKL